ncbi:Ribokinase-like protein [Trametopsis cervina]|nr:Ribokinase-like protein [Trametopsis cervina]
MEPVCLVRGSINIDEFFHVPAIVRPGETLSSTAFERRAGGKGANQAVALAQAGAKVVLVGAVGVDGGWLVQDLAARGEPTGRAIIQLTPQGENSIILHRGANYSTSPSPSPNIPYTHLLLQNEIPFSSTLSYLSHAHSTSAVSIFNPSPLPNADQLRQFPWDSLTWLIVNEGEARGLLDALDIAAADGDIGDVLWLLYASPPFAHTHIICTMGARGVAAVLSQSTSASAEADIIYVPAASLDPDSVRDTTGAGDCFTGYFVAGLMELQPGGEVLSRGDVLRVLERCVEAAGLCVQRRGAMESIPSRAEVDERVRKRSGEV